MNTLGVGRLAVLLLLCASCGGKDTAPAAKDATTAADSSAADTAVAADGGADGAAADGASDGGAADPYGSEDCDPLQPGTCALPFPSSKFLVADAATKTGWRVKFGAQTLPKNGAGKAVDAGNFSRLDGFSPGTSVLVQFADLDIAGMATQTTIGHSLDKDSPTLWLEVGPDGAVKRRIPHWAELDMRPAQPGGNAVDPKTQILFLRPGVILDYGTRYVVAFRNLRDKAGQKIPRSPAFSALVQGKTAGTQLAARQANFTNILAILAKEGVAADELTLAWDFSTGSSEALHGTMLEMRDKALAAIGDAGATVTIDTFEDTKNGKPDPNIAWTLRGTFKAPNFMKEVPVSGEGKDATMCYRWNLDAQGKLVQNGWRESKLWLRIPHAAMDGTVAHDFLQYGHGLNGDGGEVYAGWAGPNAQARKFIYASSNMIGMSEDDVPTIVQMLLDMSRFPCLTERVTAGVVEHLVLARTLKSHGAEIINKALSTKLAKPVQIKTTGQVFWSGNSQGGIYGQTVLAVSQDITRAHLGQAGLNYHMLLERSVDFEDFSGILGGMYADRPGYAVLLSVIQLLWDQVDPATYVRHIALEPFPNTPPHQALVVLHPGDFQVDPVTMEIAARSGVYKIMGQYGRAVPLVGETPMPFVGSGMVSIDFGNQWRAQSNVPPGPEPGLACGQELPQADGPCLGKSLCDPKGDFKGCILDDPHDRAHGLKAHNDQMRWFFDTGEIKDFCGGDGCRPE